MLGVKKGLEEDPKRTGRLLRFRELHMAELPRRMHGGAGVRVRKAGPHVDLQAKESLGASEGSTCCSLLRFSLSRLPFSRTQTLWTEIQVVPDYQLAHCTHLVSVWILRYGSHPFSVGDTFQDPPVDADTADSTKPYMRHVCSYTHMHTCDKALGTNQAP